MKTTVQTSRGPVRFHSVGEPIVGIPANQAIQHTPGPWKVMPCPQHHGKHPFHDSRWIATHDAIPEFGYDPRSWGLESGSLICEMRDGDIEANARLISAAPDLLAALEMAITHIDQEADRESTTEVRHAVCAHVARQARAAIARAKQP